MAFLIDQLPIAAVLIVGYVVLFAGIFAAASGAQDCTTTDGYASCSSAEPGAGSVVLMLLAMLVMVVLPLAYAIWNYGYKQGTTGQSIGKKVMKFRVVSENTGQPIGFGMSLVRQLAHMADSFACYIGYLFPLWDAKRQTFADKIMSTVCVPVSPPVAEAYPGWPG